MSFPSKLALLLLLAFPLEAQVVCTGTPQITISGQTFNGTATSLVGTTDVCSVGISETANSVCNVSNAVVAEGTAADGFETTIGFGNATADATLTLTGVATGVDATGFGIVSAAGATTCPDTANAVCIGSNAVVAEGATANAFETTLGFGNATADATLTLTGGSTGVSATGFGSVSAAAVTVTAGTGSGTATVGGVLCKGAPNQATVGTSEEVLATCTVPANTLTAAGASLRLTMFLHSAANGNNKSVKVRMGGLAGSTAYSSAVSAANNLDFFLAVPVVISRTAATTATSVGLLYSIADKSSGGAAALGTYADRALAVTWANSNDLVITGTTPSAAGDLTLDSYFVEVVQ